jgi:exodeoxyribonuclease-3
MLKLATWNVNSLRVRLPQVLEWLAREMPDVLCLQETKVPDEEFPEAAIREAGYFAAFTGQKTYNGVALLSRQPATALLRELPGVDNAQRRFLAADLDGIRVINVYVPNGESVDSEKYRFKLAWLETLTSYLRAELSAHPRLAVLGDFNIAPEDRDVHDPQAWQGQVLFSKPERAALAGLFALGLKDSFRLFEQAEASFSWWDYRQGAFRRNRGLRIDHILASPELAGVCRVCRIDVEPRRAERPSDHAPVIAEFAPG